MTLQQLKEVQAVASEGQFAKAADRTAALGQNASERNSTNAVSAFQKRIGLSFKSTSCRPIDTRRRRQGNCVRPASRPTS